MHTTASPSLPFSLPFSLVNYYCCFFFCLLQRGRGWDSSDQGFAPSVQHAAAHHSNRLRQLILLRQGHHRYGEHQRSVRSLHRIHLFRLRATTGGGAGVFFQWCVASVPSTRTDGRNLPCCAFHATCAVRHQVMVY